VIIQQYGDCQGCCGAGTRRSAVPANIFEPERRSGKYCLSEAEPTLILQRSGKSAQAAALSIMTYLNVSLKSAQAAALSIMTYLNVSL